MKLFDSAKLIHLCPSNCTVNVTSPAHGLQRDQLNPLSMGHAATIFTTRIRSLLESHVLSRVCLYSRAMGSYVIDHMGPTMALFKTSRICSLRDAPACWQVDVRPLTGRHSGSLTMKE